MRRSRAVVDDQGVQFPLDETGRRGTLGVNRAVWSDAARAVDPELAARIDATADWRAGYVPMVRAVTELGARSADAAWRVAEAGLASARARLSFRRGFEEHRLDAATSVPPALTLETEIIEGGAAPARELEVPYRGTRLAGDALRQRLAAWVLDGILEPSALEELHAVIDHPEWLRLEGRRVVVLGAGAETSPVETLLSWGAEVVALDLPRPEMWERLAAAARHGAGRLLLPRQGGGTGVDLVAAVPEVTRWLAGLAAGRPLVLGFYVYADGGAHIQATAAGDAVAGALERAGHDVTVTYTGTPSDVYLVPRDVVEDSARRRGEHRLLSLVAEPLRLLSRGRLYSAAYGAPAGEWGVADALVTQQGPNYALAKRLQRWRSMLAWRDGRAASFNVAPPTWTRSVTRNRVLAAGYHGARAAGVEVFAAETMRAIMTALLVHDLHTAPPAGEHPELAVARGAVHGGFWRQPYDIRSTLLFTTALGLPRAYMPRL